MSHYLRLLLYYWLTVLLLCTSIEKVNAQKDELRLSLHVKNPRVPRDGMLEYEVRVTNMTWDIARRIFIERGQDVYRVSGYPRDIKVIPMMLIDSSGSHWIRNRTGQKFKSKYIVDSFYNPKIDDFVLIPGGYFYGTEGRDNLVYYELPGPGSYELVVRYQGALGFDDLIAKGFWAGSLEASAPFEVVSDAEVNKAADQADKSKASGRAGGLCSMTEQTGANNPTWLAFLMVFCAWTLWRRTKR